MDKQADKNSSIKVEEKAEKDDLIIFIQKNKKQNEILKKLLKNINKTKEDE